MSGIQSYGSFAVFFLLFYPETSENTRVKRSEFNVILLSAFI